MGLTGTIEKYKQFRIPSTSVICKKASQHSKTCLFIVIIIFVALAFALQCIPHLQVAQFELSNATAVATLENQYRATLAQILGGVAVGIGIYFAWGNLKVAQKGQVTERFTRAINQLGTIDQLGNPAIEIRLGGIYALEKIANESSEDYWPIMKILTAYIRKNSSIKDQKVKEQDELQFDIQAILSIIKKRNKPNDFIEPCGLDLQDTYLYKADLSGALLGRANLQGANLREANLKEANLEGADLYGADLTGADLYGADLTRANLKRANFKEVNLANANLKEADFTEIDPTDCTIIKEANFEGANLEGANLREAYLCEANLTEAHLEGANLQGATLRGTNLTGAYLVEANLREAYLDRVPDLCLKGANLERADLTKADLKGAYLEGANIKEADFEGANLEGADFTEVDFAEDNTDSSPLSGLIKKHNLKIEQLSKVKSLYRATNLNPELEKTLKEKHSEIFKETEEHISYRENFLQSQSTL